MNQIAVTPVAGPIHGLSLTEFPTITLPEKSVPPRLRLMGELILECEGRRVDLPHSARRLLAFLATCGHPVARAHVSGSLWPDVRDERASGNLRSTLWRLRQAGTDVVDATALTVGLSPDVEVDLHELVSEARGCLAGNVASDSLEERLTGDLLPDWYDPWLVIERERVRQLRLHALEELCLRLTDQGATGRAIDVGLSAVSIEPLRESGHRALIAAHLAEGNVGEALRQYHAFRDLVRDELGVAPSSAMEDLVRPWRSGSGGRRRGAPPTRGDGAEMPSRTGR
jgi:DNA-binding SARP family transcriptional activator